jgi:hypothetical protein
MLCAWRGSLAGRERGARRKGYTRRLTCPPLLPGANYKAHGTTAVTTPREGGRSTAPKRPPEGPVSLFAVDRRQSITQEPVGASIEVAQLAIAARWCWCWCWCYLYLYYLCCTTGHPLQGSARGAGGAREPVKPSARGDICFVCSRWLCLSRGSGLSRGAGPHGKVAKPGPPSQLSGR